MSVQVLRDGTLRAVALLYALCSACGEANPSPIGDAESAAGAQAVDPPSADPGKAEDTDASDEPAEKVSGPDTGGTAPTVTEAPSETSTEMPTEAPSVLDRTQWPAYPEVVFPPENPYGEDKAVLGKLLFWDEQLSSNDTVACGTCHRPAAGGSDPRPAEPGYMGHPGADGLRGTEDDPKGSPGIAACMEVPDGAPMPLMDEVFNDGPRVGRRRSMTVLDAMFWNSMFWDGRVDDVLRDPITNEVIIPKGAALEAQALAPVVNTAEMACEGRQWDMAARKIAAARPLALASELPADLLEAQQSVATYSELFEKVFGDAEVTPVRVAMAIATYERTLVANQTPWDLWHAGDDDAMSEQEKRGFDLFVVKGACSCCHSLPLFGLPALVDDGFHEISWDGGGAEMGMDRPGNYTDPTFRTVTVRNAGLREAAGLLHDGLAPGHTLDDLMAAYNEEPVRDVHMCRRALELTDQELEDLVAFSRNALTDPRAKSEQAPFDRPRLASEGPQP
ncbi:MAG: cytochrome-c peroxidase [Myxococcales bacterium]|nr:cytochrome-c peroxidase [Myxococcales bacterium]